MLRYAFTEMCFVANNLLSNNATCQADRGTYVGVQSTAIRQDKTDAYCLSFNCSMPCIHYFVISSALPILMKLTQPTCCHRNQPGHHCRAAAVRPVGGLVTN